MMAIMGVVVAVVAAVIGALIIQSVYNANTGTFSGTTNTVMQNVPTLFALGVLGLAGIGLFAAYSR